MLLQSLNVRFPTEIPQKMCFFLAILVALHEELGVHHQLKSVVKPQPWVQQSSIATSLSTQVQHQ